METLLSVKHLKVAFKTDGGLVRAVNDVSFDLKEGETLGIVGESGSGKSVSSMAIMRLLPPATTRIDPESQILFKGQDLLKAKEEYMRKIRGKEIAMIFQDPMTSLNPVITIGKTDHRKPHLAYEATWPGGRPPGYRTAQAGRDSFGREAAQRLSAPVFGWYAPARDDRNGS